MPLVKIVRPKDVHPSEIQGYYAPFFGKLIEKHPDNRYWGIYFPPSFILDEPTGGSLADLIHFKCGGNDIEDLRENVEFSQKHGRLELDGSIINYSFTIDEPFTVSDDESTLDYGPCRVSFSFDLTYSEAYAPYVQGLTKRHPHTSSSGELCLGHTYRTISKLCKSGDFYEASEVIKSVLRSYDPNACYLSIQEIITMENRE